MAETLWDRVEKEAAGPEGWWHGSTGDDVTAAVRSMIEAEHG